jgi:hypothetical protein
MGHAAWGMRQEASAIELFSVRTNGGRDCLSAGAGEHSAFASRRSLVVLS